MQNKVLGPAIGLMVLGILGALVQIPSFFVSYIDPSFVDQIELPIEEQYRDQFKDMLRASIEESSVVWSIVFIVLNLVIFFAGVRLLSMKSWTLGVVACVLVMITCLFQCCCCPIGLPIGIWGLIVLFDGDVKQAFEAKPAA